jgi:hypothetical protein
VRRGAFVLAGVLMLAGGPLHPDGTMAQMLLHPNWVLSHALMTCGFAALVLGTFLLPPGVTWTAGARRWRQLALAGAVLQTIEMVFHTVSYVDANNLVAGQSTPVLSTHLALSVVCYPAFGATWIGFIIATARERLFGPPWIAWLGVAGALAHGLSAPLVVGLGVEGARILFPLLMLFALWSILGAVWPVRRS